MNANVIEFYELSARMRAILASLDDSGGELTPEVATELDALAADTEAGVVEFALACKELQVNAAANEAIEFRHRDRKRAQRAAMQRLRDAIEDHMVQAEVPKVRHPLVTVSTFDLDPEVIWDGKDDRIPEEFRITLTEYRVNKEAVLRAAAEDVPLPEGMRLKARKSVRIT